MPRNCAQSSCAAGIVAEIVVDDTDDLDRERIFGAFDKREIRVLVSVGVLAIGFDSPVAACAILARPTMSTSLHIQQGGRVLRPFEGKADALILDHAGNTLACTAGSRISCHPATCRWWIGAPTSGRAARLAEAWVCKGCEAINAMHDDICVECGLPRRRHTELVVLDGELVSVEATPGQALPGPTLPDLRNFYLMSLWYGRSKQFQKAEAWSYYATQRRFRLGRRQRPRS